MSDPLSILLAEDDEMDVVLFRRALKDAAVTNPLHVAADGQFAIEFLMRTRNTSNERLPGLVVLDIKMPRRDGFQVLEWIKQQPVIRSIPVTIFSSSANRHDIERAYDSGASAYLIKPPSIAARAELANFIKDWLRLVQPPLSAVEGFKAAQAERSVLEVRPPA